MTVQGAEFMKLSEVEAKRVILELVRGCCNTL
jgi:hypothetical protein